MLLKLRYSELHLMTVIKCYLCALSINVTDSSQWISKYEVYRIGYISRAYINWSSFYTLFYFAIYIK